MSYLSCGCCDILPPVQYSTQKIPQIRNIQKTIIFHIFPYISSAIISPYTCIKNKNKKLLTNGKVPRPPSETRSPRSKFVFCTRIAKMNISMVKIFVQRSFKTTFLSNTRSELKTNHQNSFITHLFKLWSLKLDFFFYKISQNKNSNGKIISWTELLNFWNNFPLIPALQWR